MAKTTAPLLSFGASGQIAKTMVTSSWKGVPYTRRYVVPANPRTEEQTKTRSTFAFMREMWKLAPLVLQAPWNAFAKGRPFTGMNKFVGENIRVLRGDANMNDFIGSPGAAGGLAPTAFTATDAAADGQVDLLFTIPDAPDGWTLVSADYVAFPDGDPATYFNGPYFSGSITEAPYSATVDGLTNAQAYQFAGWLHWTKPNGADAYSVGITQHATPTA